MSLPALAWRLSEASPNLNSAASTVSQAFDTRLHSGCLIAVLTIEAIALRELEKQSSILNCFQKMTARLPRCSLDKAPAITQQQATSNRALHSLTLLVAKL